MSARTVGVDPEALENRDKARAREAHRPMLIGEANPYGADPHFALYPDPEHSAGGRLCRLIMEMPVRQYLSRFQRRNLCINRWSIDQARDSAVSILNTTPDGAVLVLLGAKVNKAFGLSFAPFTVREIATPDGHCRAVTLPHPSGLNRMWRQPGAVDRAREVLRAAGALS